MRVMRVVLILKSGYVSRMKCDGSNIWVGAESVIAGFVSATIFIILSVVAVVATALLTFFASKGGLRVSLPIPLGVILIPLCEETVRIAVVRSRLVNNYASLSIFTAIIIIFEMTPKIIRHQDFGNFSQIAIFLILATPPICVHYISGVLDYRSKSGTLYNVLLAFSFAFFIHFFQYICAVKSGNGQVYAMIVPVTMLSAVAILHWRGINTFIKRYNALES